MMSEYPAHRMTFVRAGCSPGRLRIKSRMWGIVAEVREIICVLLGVFRGVNGTDERFVSPSNRILVWGKRAKVSV